MTPGSISTCAIVGSTAALYFCCVDFRTANAVTRSAARSKPRKIKFMYCFGCWEVTKGVSTGVLTGRGGDSFMSIDFLSLTFVCLAITFYIFKYRRGCQVAQFVLLKIVKFLYK